MISFVSLGGIHSHLCRNDSAVVACQFLLRTRYRSTVVAADVKWHASALAGELAQPCVPELPSGVEMAPGRRETYCADGRSTVVKPVSGWRVVHSLSAPQQCDFATELHYNEQATRQSGGVESQERDWCSWR
jgi:hypothetical protein